MTGILLGINNFILAANTVDFYDAESHAGNSYWPFIGFMCFLLGIVIIFVGYVKQSTAKKQWNLFYDQRDRKDFTEEKYVKERKAGKIIMVIGVVLLVVSFFLL